MTDGSQPTDSTDRYTPNNHVSVFPYPGGKGRQSDWILEKMPPHDTFVDVFGGSGAIIYNKPRSKNEIYNDTNDDLVQFFNVLRTREDELVEWLRCVPYSRSLYEQWVNEYFEGVRPDDPVERAGRFFTLRYMQFAGDISMVNGFKTRAKRSPSRTFDNARERIHELANRFRQVTVEHRDYADIFETYDDSEVDVLFYCDPPYVGGEHYYPGEFDHAEFVATLDDLENDWMVSYAELPPGLEDLGHVVARDRRHRMCRSASDATEHLVCSFDPTERSQFLANGTEQQTLRTATDDRDTADTESGHEIRTDGGLDTRTLRVGSARSVAYGPAGAPAEEWALRFTTEGAERVAVRLDEDAMYQLWTEVHDVPWPSTGSVGGDLRREVVARAERADAETLRDVLDVLGGEQA